MNILIIDTSTQIEIVAAASETAYASQTRPISVSHSATLFESIDKTLKEINIELSELDLIGVGIGPGSFTGIRIAVTTARMLSQILNLPLVGIKSQLLYASSAIRETEINDNILIAFDARKGKIFGALYRNEVELTEIVKPGDYKIDYLLAKIDTAKGTLLIGNGCEKFESEIKSKITNMKYLPDYLPSAEIICNLVKNKYTANPKAFKDYNDVVPNYSRASDAELIKKSGK